MDCQRRYFTTSRRQACNSLGSTQPCRCNDPTFTEWPGVVVMSCSNRDWTIGRWEPMVRWCRTSTASVRRGGPFSRVSPKLRIDHNFRRRMFSHGSVANGASTPILWRHNATPPALWPINSSQPHETRDIESDNGHPHRQLPTCPPPHQDDCDGAEAVADTVYHPLPEEPKAG